MIMKKKQKVRHRLSRISRMHYFKLVFRSCLFLAAAVVYCADLGQGSEDLFAAAKKVPVILPLVWLVFVVEMILRFFSSSIESMGCQKQFARNYRPVDQNANGESMDHQGKKVVVKLETWKSTLAVAAAWFFLNGIIGVLYFGHIIDAGILFLISLAYSVYDMICILFFCPFQTWFMKNKCCTSCRIYNWDYAMMFTPLVFVPSVYTWSMLLVAIVLLVRWEIAVHCYPERFSESTNACLSCAGCQEKLCSHKKQLQRYLKEKRYQTIPVSVAQQQL